MLAQHASLQIDDLARIGGTGAQLFDHAGIIAIRDEADVLTVGLVGDGEAEFRRQRPGLGLAGKPAQRKAQEIQLLGRGREQEIALVTGRIGRHMQLCALFAVKSADIMPGRHAIGVKFARGLQQVAELHPLIAADAGHRGGAGQIGVGKFLDHRFPELVFVIQHVMRKADALCHAAGIVNVLPCAACAFFRQGRAVIVKL